MKKLFTLSRISIGFFVLLFTLFYWQRAKAQCTDASAATSYATNNAQRGAMFNITAGSNSITITSFDANIPNGSTARYEIYFKAGTYVGSETTAASWTLAGSINSLTSAGLNVPTAIPIPLSITIPANSTYGFYITSTTAPGGMSYTNSAIGNVTLASNSDLTLTGGVGKAYPFSTTYSYRLINCTVHYYTGNVTETSTLATSTATSAGVIQNGSGSTLYSSACNALISKVTGTGASPVSGITTAKVWIDASQAAQYVKRHYQITPTTNGSGRVTLYFTDAEFNDFNTQTVPPAFLLPVSTDPATITARKANLRIEKRSGSSSDNTGSLTSYTGSIETIDPNDADIVWNATASRWEVSFDVSGFSGFWAKTSVNTLPLKLLAFSGSRRNNVNELTWKTAAEINTREFVIERSTDGITFTPIASVASQKSGDHTYTFNDQVTINGNLHYRLKMIDEDNQFSYSGIIRINTTGSGSLRVYPNPVKDMLSITVGTNILPGSKAWLTDIKGRVWLQFTINSTTAIIPVKQLPPGMYILRLENGSVQKIIKE